MKISKTSPSPRSPEFLVFLRKAHSLTSTLCISYFAKYLKCSLTHCIEVVFLSVCLLLQSSPPSVLPWAQLFPFAPSSHTVVPVSWPPLLPDMDLALQTDSLCAGSISLTPSILEQPSPFLSGPGRLPAAFSHSLSSSLKSPASVPTTHSLPPSGTGLLQALPPKSAKVTHGSFSPWRSSGSLSRVPSTPRRQKKQALEAELTSRKRLLLFGLSSVFLFFCCFFFSSSPYRFDPWVMNIAWSRKWQPTPVFLSGKIPWTGEPGRLQSMGSEKSWTWLSTHARLWSPALTSRTVSFLPWCLFFILSFSTSLGSWQVFTVYTL